MEEQGIGTEWECKQEAGRGLHSPGVQPVVDWNSAVGRSSHLGQSFNLYSYLGLDI